MSGFGWEELEKGISVAKARTAKKTLREHQLNASSKNPWERGRLASIPRGF